MTVGTGSIATYSPIHFVCGCPLKDPAKRGDVVSGIVMTVYACGLGGSVGPVRAPDRTVGRVG